MADLTPAQRAEYWRYNVRLTVVLLLVWFVVTFVLGGVLASALNEIVVFGFPLGYYVAAQGSIVVFLIETLVYARLMNAKDLEVGIREEA
jgi:putative solute:sodium symporter small subunit